MDLDAIVSSYFTLSENSHQPLSCLGKIIQGQQKVSIRHVVTKKINNVCEGRNPETIWTLDPHAKTLFHGECWYH